MRFIKRAPATLITGELTSFPYKSSVLPSNYSDNFAKSISTQTKSAASPTYPQNIILFGCPLKAIINSSSKIRQPIMLTVDATELLLIRADCKK